MKKSVYMLAFAINCIHCFCQTIEDPNSIAHGEPWKVQQHKGLFGFAKPEFGPFRTLSVSPLDTPARKRKIKEGTSLDFEFSSGGSDIDHGKFVTIIKTKFYRLNVTMQADTFDAVFSISSVSRERRQTVLGKLLSKNDEDKDLVLHYHRDVTGLIRGTGDTTWKFAIKNFFSGARQAPEYGIPTISFDDLWITNQTDSIFVRYSPSAGDFLLISRLIGPVASIKLCQKPSIVSMRNDIDLAYIKALGAFSALLLTLKDW